MVRQGDFEVTLVHAEGETKATFPEHIKDGQVYVEVEPEQEYFICIQRVGNDVNGPLLARLSVDDKRLEHYHFFKSGRRSGGGGGDTAAATAGPPTYHGLCVLNKNDNNNDIHDTWTDTALKFTKPRLLQQQEGKPPQQRRARLLIGKIQVEFYKAIVVVNKERNQASSSSISPTQKSPPSKQQQPWKASAIRTTPGPNRIIELKGLRSGQGSTSFMKQRKIRQQQPRSYKRGEQVYVFTLHYCAAMGLMQVGVLSKPPVWVYHKMLPSPQKRAPSVSTAAAAEANNDDDDDVDDDDTASPISTATGTTVDSSSTTTTTTTPAQTIVRTHELIDLTDDNDDDSDNDNDSNRNEKSPMVEMNV